VALVKVAIRNREQLATLRVREGVIVLETMIWPDEVREADFGFLDEDIELRPQEQQMARSLVDSMAGEFNPSEFTDNYREALESVIEAKIEGREIVEAEEPQPDAGNVVDLMSALRASVDAAKKTRGETAPAGKAREGDAAAEKAPAAKAGAGKAPAKKAAAKAGAGKAPAKKAAAKKAGTKKAAAKKAATRKSA
jgi:DNA end-binding protein Ku